jgi:hypothetical protein
LLADLLIFQGQRIKLVGQTNQKIVQISFTILILEATPCVEGILEGNSFDKVGYVSLCGQATSCQSKKWPTVTPQIFVKDIASIEGDFVNIPG